MRFIPLAVLTALLLAGDVYQLSQPPYDWTSLWQSGSETAQPFSAYTTPFSSVTFLPFGQP